MPDIFSEEYLKQNQGNIPPDIFQMAQEDAENYKFENLDPYIQYFIATGGETLLSPYEFYQRQIGESEMYNIPERYDDYIEYLAFFDPTSYERSAYEHQSFLDRNIRMLGGMYVGLQAGILRSIGDTLAFIEGAFTGENIFETENFLTKMADYLQEDIVGKELAIFDGGDKTSKIMNITQSLGYTLGIVSESIGEAILAEAATGFLGTAGVVGNLARKYRSLAQIVDSIWKGTRVFREHPITKSVLSMATYQNVKESYSNARDVYKAIMDNAKMNGFDDFESAKIAYEKARDVLALQSAVGFFTNQISFANTFGRSYLWQALKASKFGRFLSDAVEEGVEHAVKKGKKVSLRKGIVELTTTMASEGAEEWWQESTMMWAENQAGVDMKFEVSKSAFDIAFSDRAIESLIAGAMGGAMFKTLGFMAKKIPFFRKFVESSDDNAAAFESNYDVLKAQERATFKRFSLANQLMRDESIEEMDKYLDELGADGEIQQGLDAMVREYYDDVVNGKEFEKWKTKKEEEIKALQEAISTETNPERQNELQKILDIHTTSYNKTMEAEKEFKKLKNLRQFKRRKNKVAMQKLLYNDFLSKKSIEKIREVESKIDDITKTMDEENRLSTERKALEEEINILKKQKKHLEEIREKGNKKREELKRDDNYSEILHYDEYNFTEVDDTYYKETLRELEKMIVQKENLMKNIEELFDKKGISYSSNKINDELLSLYKSKSKLEFSNKLINLETNLLYNEKIATKWARNVYIRKIRNEVNPFLAEAYYKSAKKSGLFDSIIDRADIEYLLKEKRKAFDNKKTSIKAKLQKAINKFSLVKEGINNNIIKKLLKDNETSEIGVALLYINDEIKKIGLINRLTKEKKDELISIMKKILKETESDEKLNDVYEIVKRLLEKIEKKKVVDTKDQSEALKQTIGNLNIPDNVTSIDNNILNKKEEELEDWEKHWRNIVILRNSEAIKDGYSETDPIQYNGIKPDNEIKNLLRTPASGDKKGEIIYKMLTKKGNILELSRELWEGKISIDELFSSKAGDEMRELLIELILEIDNNKFKNNSLELDSKLIDNIVEEFMEFMEGDSLQVINHYLTSALFKLQGIDNPMPMHAIYDNILRSINKRLLNKTFIVNAEMYNFDKLLTWKVDSFGRLHTWIAGAHYFTKEVKKTNNSNGLGKAMSTLFNTGSEYYYNDRKIDDREKKRFEINEGKKLKVTYDKELKTLTEDEKSKFEEVVKNIKSGKRGGKYMLSKDEIELLNKINVYFSDGEYNIAHIIETGYDSENVFNPSRTPITRAEFLHRYILSGEFEVKITNVIDYINIGDKERTISELKKDYFGFDFYIVEEKDVLNKDRRIPTISETNAYIKTSINQEEYYISLNTEKLTDEEADTLFQFIILLLRTSSKQQQIETSQDPNISAIIEENKKFEESIKYIDEAPNDINSIVEYLKKFIPEISADRGGEGLFIEKSGKNQQWAITFKFIDKDTKKMNTYKIALDVNKFMDIDFDKLRLAIHNLKIQFNKEAYYGDNRIHQVYIWKKNPNKTSPDDNEYIVERKGYKEFIDEKLKSGIRMSKYGNDIIISTKRLYEYRVVDEKRVIYNKNNTNNNPNNTYVKDIKIHKELSVGDIILDNGQAFSDAVKNIKGFINSGSALHQKLEKIRSSSLNRQITNEHIKYIENIYTYKDKLRNITVKPMIIEGDSGIIYIRAMGLPIHIVVPKWLSIDRESVKRIYQEVKNLVGEEVDIDIGEYIIKKDGEISIKMGRLNNMIEDNNNNIKVYEC